MQSAHSIWNSFRCVIMSVVIVFVSPAPSEMATIRETHDTTQYAIKCIIFYKRGAALLMYYI